MRGSVILVLCGIVLASCGRPQPGDGKPTEFVKLKAYTWELMGEDPQARWNPTRPLAIACSRTGLIVHHEGGKTSQNYAFPDGRRAWDPVWINDHQVVFGPEPRMRKDEVGREVPPKDGLMVTTLGLAGLTEPAALGSIGYRPRAWPFRGVVVCSIGHEIRQYHPSGAFRILEVGGFEPEPQPDGPGFAFLDKPFFEEDRWTGKAGRGQAVIRWDEGVVDTLAEVVEMRWTPWGGILCTVLEGEVPKGKPWWTGTTRMMHIAGPGAKPTLVMAGGHAPAIHPTEGIVAALDAKNRLFLVTLDGKEELLLAEEAQRPEWHNDGRRLMYQVPSGEKGLAALFVQVFSLAKRPR